MFVIFHERVKAIKMLGFSKILRIAWTVRKCYDLVIIKIAPFKILAIKFLSGGILFGEIGL